MPTFSANRTEADDIQLSFEVVVKCLREKWSLNSFTDIMQHSPTLWHSLHGLSLQRPRRSFRLQCGAHFRYMGCPCTFPKYVSGCSVEHIFATWGVFTPSKYIFPAVLWSTFSLHELSFHRHEIFFRLQGGPHFAYMGCLCTVQKYVSGCIVEHIAAGFKIGAGGFKIGAAGFRIRAVGFKIGATGFKIVGSR